MIEIPTDVTDYIIHFTVVNRSLAYIFTNKEACLSDWGGQLSVYGITDLQRGKDIGQQVFFLEGLLPLDDFPLFLPCMKTEKGICADVHLFPSKQGDWVIFLDAMWDETHIRRIQQQINNSKLIEENFRRILKHT